MKKLSLFLVLLSFLSCKDNQPLPILGRTIVEDGVTIQHQIPDFALRNQDSTIVTNADLANHLYISDFFFMSCPTICPRVKKQMLRLYDEYKTNDEIKFVSHSVDGERDTPAALNTYAKNLGVDTKQWMFLTGERGAVIDIADDYFVAAFEDADAPGGYDHSGKIILVDKDRHVRAFCEGTDPDDVTDFFNDVEKLLDEYKK